MNQMKLSSIWIFGLFIIFLLPFSVNADCISGDCTNGYGVYQWPDGNTYAGDWLDNKRSGQGTFIWNNGNKYEGKWLNNTMTGYGVMQWADGSTYAGEWHNDMMHGTGTRKSVNGDIYEGQWKNNVQTGKGTFIWRNGDKYEGDWNSNIQSGKGIFIWRNGDKYEGDWHNNMMNGYGTMHWAAGNTYTGQWQNDKMNGQGTMIWANGNKYIGQWQNDQMNGYGTMTWISGNTYTGQWENGQKKKSDSSKPPEPKPQESSFVLVMNNTVKPEQTEESRTQFQNNIKPFEKPAISDTYQNQSINEAKPDKRGIKRKKNKITEKRLALVIGNGSYMTSPLINPPNDAQDMAKSLRDLAFEVEQLINGGQDEMKKAVRRFGKRLKQGGAGLFYYAGHGMQVNGRNYLIPVDAKIESESDVEYEAVDAGRILGKMEDAGNDLNIVILDACRNNPFARSFRSSTQGLSKMDAPRGTMIVYATAPDSVAADGQDRNGVFTKYLLKHMKTPGMPVETMLKSVRRDVIKETNERQTPWESSSLTGDFYFNPEDQKEDAPILADTSAAFEMQPSAEPVAPLFSLLTVRANVVGASVWFDEAEMGKTPLKIRNIKAGQHRIKIVAQNYETYEKTLEFEPGKSQTLTALLEKDLSSSTSKLEYREIDRDGKFIAYNDGTVLDTETGLLWAARDNGVDINWQASEIYCKNFQLGGYSDWRLPTIEELEKLYDRNNPGYGPECHPMWNVSLTKLIKLSCVWVWSSKINGSAAVFFNFVSGKRGEFPLSLSFTTRVLPVRRAK